MIPVYPWPRHPEYFRRRELLDSRRRLLALRGLPVYPDDASPSRVLRLNEAIKSDPFAAGDVSYQQIGATPQMPGDPDHPFTANIRTSDYAAIIPDWYAASIPRGQSGPATRTVYADRAYSQIQNYGHESVVRTAPYFGWLGVLVDVTPTEWVSGVLIYRPSFSPTLGTIGPVQRTYMGNYYRLAYDGSIYFDGQTTASVQRLAPWFANSMWIDRHPLNSDQNADLDAFIANNNFFSSLTEHSYTAPITVNGPDRSSAAYLTTVSWNIARPTSGRWIAIGSGCLIGEGNYRYVATSETYQPGSVFSGTILQQDGAYALEEDGRLWLHDLRSNTRTLVGTGILTFYRQISETYSVSSNLSVTELPPEPHTL